MRSRKAGRAAGSHDYKPFSVGRNAAQRSYGMVRLFVGHTGSGLHWAGWGGGGAVTALRLLRPTFTAVPGPVAVAGHLYIFRIKTVAGN